MSLVIFDCDGVLVDSETLVVAIEVEMLRALGIDVTVDEVLDTFVGLSEASIRHRIEADWGVRLPDGFAAEKAARVHDEFTRSLRAVDGMREVVHGLAVERCVASSSAPPRLNRSLSLAGLADAFGDAVFSASMVAKGKPAPDLFLHAAATLGHDPDRCVVVEDSPYGVAAGRAAGMYVVGFTGGSHCRDGHDDTLRDAGADTVVRDAAELGAVLLSTAR